MLDLAAASCDLFFFKVPIQIPSLDLDPYQNDSHTRKAHELDRFVSCRDVKQFHRSDLQILGRKQIRNRTG